jgi:translation initiation factor IF-2
MNNGKVRIYELSKELNLDNRDILTVCDKLSISVKSHSSTITEEEAAQIRAAAEKYTPTSSHKPTSAPSSTTSTSKQSTLKPPVKKQQILEIRRNRPLTEPPRRPEAEVTAPAVTNSTPPPAQQQPAKLSAPTRPPARPGELDNDVVDEGAVVSEGLDDNILADAVLDSATDTEINESVAELETPELGVAVTTNLEQPVAVESATSKTSVTASKELVVPPSRPVAKSPHAVTSSSANRPTLRKARVDTADQSAPDNGGRATEIILTTKDAPRRNENPAIADGPPLRAKPIIELRHKPSRPAGNTGEAKVGADGTTAPPAPGDDLRRPTPPRPPKKNKGWEEEEDDEQETAAKAAKAAATKTKRRVQPVIEDEDELVAGALLDDDDENDNGEPSPIQISLSLARPAKQKAKPGSKPAVASFSPPKSKRSGSDSGNSRGFKRDRRQEEVRQRPEQITLTGSLSVHDLADLLGVPETELIKVLFVKGIAANINQILDIPTAAMVAQEFEIEVETGLVEAEAKKVTEMIDASDLDHLIRRPPVVTIMGHVDHGKTTLLDSIRKTKVAQGEAGGITQHIGAYHVDVEHGDQMQQVVFLDTPGHEAFTAMRARGARVTDVAILVVAADDGVRPQTVEAISHAKAAGVPIIVAINKIDKEGAQPDRVKQELTEYGLVSEEWGGDTVMVPVSAIKGENLETLLEMILLVSEVEDLYANPDRPAKGTVIEANLDKARGPVASLIVQNGTLKVGDILVAGSVFGKVRAMIDDRGKRVTVAGPSYAVEVLGLSDVPAAGDEFEVYRDEKEARSLASDRSDQQRLSRLQQAMASRRVSLTTISAQAQEGELKELNLILKADVQGSVEAILGSLQQLPQKEVQVRVLLAAPGEITETDVDLAAASSAVIVGFNTTLASGARQAADKAGIDVRDYNIIYKLLEDIQGAMEGLLDPEMVEEPLGQVEVRAVFPVGRGAVAGCYVLSGKIIRNSRVRVRRGNEIVHEGNLDSLKRMKEDTKEVNAGYECGIGLDNFKDWVEKDIIEVFRLVSKRRTLSA